MLHKQSFHSFQQIDNRFGSRGERVTSADSTADEEREGCM